MFQQGLSGTARVMFHEVKRIRLEVYLLNLASTGGPSARTIVPYSPSGPHLPERSQSQHPKKDGLWAVVYPVLTKRRTDWFGLTVDRHKSLFCYHKCGYPSISARVDLASVPSYLEYRIAVKLHKSCQVCHVHSSFYLSFYRMRSSSHLLTRKYSAGISPCVPHTLSIALVITGLLCNDLPKWLTR